MPYKLENVFSKEENFPLYLSSSRMWVLTHLAVYNFFPLLEQVPVTSLLLRCSVVCDSWRPHGLQHVRLPCPSTSLEFAQIHIHCVGDATYPSHPSHFSSVQFSPSVVSDSLRPHGLQHVRLTCPSYLELAQTHVHWIGDAIQPSHPLSPSSPPAFNLSQHQGLFKWVSYSHQVAKVLELRLQHQPFQWIFRTDFL